MVVHTSAGDCMGAVLYDTSYRPVSKTTTGCAVAMIPLPNIRPMGPKSGLADAQITKTMT